MKKYDEEINFLSIAGEEYYLDMDRIGEFIRIERPDKSVDDLLASINKEPKKESEYSNEVGDTDEGNAKEEMFGQIIDVTKWELTKVMIEAILSEHGPVDEAMGFNGLDKQLSIPFKISFNTLLKNKIIKTNGR